MGELVYFRMEGWPANDPNSYRPIILLSIFEKIYEKLFLRRINPALIESNTLTDLQHGLILLN